MYCAFKKCLIMFVMSVFLCGCSESRWIEWENKYKNPLLGSKFKFTQPMCYLVITPKKTSDSLDVDIALGKYIQEEKGYLDTSSFKCESINNDDEFTIIRSYYLRHAWWLIGASDHQFFILENKEKMRSLVSILSLYKTSNDDLNNYSNRVRNVWKK